MNTSQGPDDWFIDSGSSAHDMGDRTLLSHIRITPRFTITTIGGNALPIVGHGMTILVGNKEIENVLYMPDLKKNFLSFDKFTNVGYFTLFGP
jgi:hypothetical protein